MSAERARSARTIRGHAGVRRRNPSGMPQTLMNAAGPPLASRVRKRAWQLGLWTARQATRGTNNGDDLSRWPVVPGRLTRPLLRAGTDPVAELGELRRRAPVSRLTRTLGLTVWLVCGYREVRSVLGDPTGFSTDIRPFTGANTTRIRGLGFTDPPDHTRLRKFLIPAFGARRIAELRPQIERAVDDQLDRLASTHGARDGAVIDLVSGFATAVPLAVIGDLLGLTSAALGRIQRAGAQRFDVSAGGGKPFGAIGAAQDLLLDEVRRQRRRPGVGLIADLIREHGDDIDDVELAGLADGVLTGGYETSASMLSLSALVLLNEPALFRAFQQPSEPLDGAVEELLRVLSVVQVAFPRFARHDTRIGGVRIRAGDVVVCSLSTADRDESFGSDPDRVDPSRRAGPHLAFGHGLHRCIGSELARLQLKVALPALVRRFPRLHLAADPSELQFRELSLVYGLRALPVRLAPLNQVQP